MLSETELHEGGRPKENQLHDATSLPKLSDLGIKKTESYNLQTIASIPEEVFEKHIAEVKEKKEELTTDG